MRILTYPYPAGGYSPKKPAINIKEYKMLKKKTVKTTEPTEEVLLHVTRTKEGISVRGSISQSDLFQVVLNLLSEIHPETWNLV